jgi:hypothetical protein
MRTQPQVLTLRDQPRQTVRACNCIGPQNGEPRCPCMMGAYREQQAGKSALEFLRKLALHGKPRVRVKAGSRVVGNA